MTGRWGKQLLKVADICIAMPFNDSVWNNCNFEPLIIAIIIPFHNAPPWKLKHTSFVRENERKLQVLWKDDFFLGRDFFVRTIQKREDIGELAEEYGAGYVARRQEGKVIVW